MAELKDFTKLEIRTGKIVDVRTFPEAHKPAYKLLIDFGNDIGVKKSSAQLVDNYTPSDLMDKMILAVVNFSPLQIGNFISEVLVLGVPDKNGFTILVKPESEVDAGAKLY